MKFIYYFLILFFAILLFVEIFYNFKSYFINLRPLKIEGLENNNTKQDKKNKQNSYKPYNFDGPNGALILAQQNAGNIDYLKIRIDELNGIKGRVDQMQLDIDSMQTQIDSLVEQQQQLGNDLVGTNEVEVSGTEEMTTNEVENNIQEGEIM